MNNLISIIIVNYNGRKWLQKCLNSLYSQTYKDFEIIFVDNASSDESIEFIKNNYNDNRIKIVRSEKNLGFAGGNNLGIKNSSGDYILLLNNDTWVDDDFLDKTFSFYKKNNFDIVAPMENDYDNQTKTKYFFTVDLLGHCMYKKQSNNKSGFYLGGVCLFFKNNLYKETLGLDNNFFMYFEEVDWFWRLHLLRKKIGMINNVHVHHAGAGSTGTGIKYQLFLWRNQNALQMLLKNYKAFNLLWVLPIYFIQNIFEMIFFLLILKPKITYSYIQGWWFNIINIKKILNKRKWVQKNRKIGDRQIMKKMYLGFAKFHHLLRFINFKDNIYAK